MIRRTNSFPNGAAYADCSVGLMKGIRPFSAIGRKYSKCDRFEIKISTEKKTNTVICTKKRMLVVRAKASIPW